MEIVSDVVKEIITTQVSQACDEVLSALFLLSNYLLFKFQSLVLERTMVNV